MPCLLVFSRQYWCIFLKEKCLFQCYSSPVIGWKTPLWVMRLLNPLRRESYLPSVRLARLCIQWSCSGLISWIFGNQQKCVVNASLKAPGLVSVLGCFRRSDRFGLLPRHRFSLLYVDPVCLQNVSHLLFAQKTQAYVLYPRHTLTKIEFVCFCILH